MEDARPIPVYIKHPDSAEFGSRLLQNHPAPVVDSYILDEIARIGGKDRFGDPMLRLMWGQSIFRTAFGQTRMRYSLQTYESATGEYYDIGSPRFIVESKIDPIFIDLEGWNVPMQGPKPIRGLYQFVCAIQTPEGGFCYPDSRHIAAIKRMRWAREQDPLTYSHEEKKPEYERLKKIKETTDAIADRDAKRKAARREMIHEHYKSRKRRMFHHLPNEGRIPDPYVESKKQKSKGGIILP